MSSKRRKEKPVLRDEGWSWLAQVCTDQQWNRCLDLSRISIGALFDYVKTLADPVLYRQFEEKNLEPEVLAARRKVEAEKAEKEAIASRTIHRGLLPKTTALEKIFDAREGRGWHTAEHTSQKERERIAAEKAAKEDNSIVGFPEPVFDK